MQGVELVLGLLSQDTLDFVQHRFSLETDIFRHLVSLAVDLPVHASNTGLERAQRPLHPAVLLRKGIATHLGGQPLGFAVEVLAQRNVFVLG